MYNNLGVLYYANLDVERAQAMHERALKIRQELPPTELDPGDLSQTYINLGAVYKALGDFQKAEECVDRAKRIRADLSAAQSVPRRSAALLLDRSA